MAKINLDRKLDAYKTKNLDGKYYKSWKMGFYYNEGFYYDEAEGFYYDTVSLIPPIADFLLFCLEISLWPARWILLRSAAGS